MLKGSPGSWNKQPGTWTVDSRESHCRLFSVAELEGCGGRRVVRVYSSDFDKDETWGDGASDVYAGNYHGRMKGSAVTKKKQARERDCGF